MAEYKEVKDTLEFWHPRADSGLPVEWLNWGTVAPGSSEDRVFRVRNSSAIYTATGVVISLEELDLFDAALPVPVQHFLSFDGRRFTSTLTIPALSPGVVSELITIRRVTARQADEGPGEFQVAATVSDWK